MELGRNRSAWRNLWLPCMAFSPVFIFGIHGLRAGSCERADETLMLAAVIQLYYLRFAIYFGCLGIFMRLVGGEVTERTLHYLFMAPVRRELLVLGKFLAGTLITVLVFGAGVLLSFVLTYGHFAAGREFLFHGAGPDHLRAYLLAAALGCVGYGSVFLAMSLLVRNPVGPAVVLLLWEGINGVLPVWLKRFSVSYYLQPLLPAELPPQGFLALFTVVSEPMTPGVAVAGLLAFAGLVLVFACWRIRRFEVSYSVD
jgi:ABC-type transport system involved in multi-copper enzyme maturation permease subunit